MIQKSVHKQVPSKFPSWRKNACKVRAGLDPPKTIGCVISIEVWYRTVLSCQAKTQIDLASSFWANSLAWHTDLSANNTTTHKQLYTYRHKEWLLDVQFEIYYVFEYSVQHHSLARLHPKYRSQTSWFNCVIKIKSYEKQINTCVWVCAACACTFDLDLTFFIWHRIIANKLIKMSPEVKRWLSYLNLGK